MSDTGVIGVIDALKAENKRLRADLAAERERKKSYMQCEITEYERAEKAERKVTKLREALEWLVTLKDERDRYGKTPEYEAKKAQAWVSARAALTETGGGDE
jgi:hypothetical protein